MSTKNLARTVIEGGRSNWDKHCRRISLRYWRNDNRRWCDGVRKGRIDPEDTLAPARVVEFRGKSEIHADKTSPVSRFLRARAGRPWADVRSEVCRRFDRRKLAGKHVVNDHLLGLVHETDLTSYSWSRPSGMIPKEEAEFWVDDGGILRHTPDGRY